MDNYESAIESERERERKRERENRERERKHQGKKDGISTINKSTWSSLRETKKESKIER